MSKTTKKTLTALCFILPFFLLYAIFTIWPVFQGLYVSFHKWTLMGKQDFVGGANYIKLIRDAAFWRNLKNTCIYVAETVPFLLLLGIGLALLANRATKLKKIYRISFYLPNILSVTVISYLAMYIFYPYSGFLSNLLHDFGILQQGQEIFWLKEKVLCYITVGIATVWWTVGFCMLLFLAALQEIPDQLYEAASIDGATKAKQLFHITLPLLNPTTLMVLMLQIIASFKIFAQAKLITNGGPGNLTESSIMYIYRTAFTNNDMGYSSAMSYALFIILVILTLFQLALQRKGEVK